MVYNFQCRFYSSTGYGQTTTNNLTSLACKKGQSKNTTKRARPRNKTKKHYSQLSKRRWGSVKKGIGQNELQSTDKPEILEPVLCQNRRRSHQEAFEDAPSIDNVTSNNVSNETIIHERDSVPRRILRCRKQTKLDQQQQLSENSKIPKTPSFKNIELTLPGSSCESRALNN